MFPPSAVERVQLAQRALQLGFSLKELSEILRIRDDGGVPCDRVLNLTEQKLRSLARQIQELQRTQDYLRKLVREWRSKLEKTPKGTRAMLLESLAKEPRVRPATGNLKRRPQR
jgi:DNA-binding transcriptional MerR regulator